MHHSMNEIISYVRDVPDFPKPGILFKDITPILENHAIFRSLVLHFCEVISSETQKLLAIESRGFILASAISQHLKAGVVLVRKAGKLPGPTYQHSYALEYGTDTLEIQQQSIDPGDKVTIIDDVLATGGTAHATEQLAEKTGAEVLGHCFFMEIQALKGSKRLAKPYHSFVQI